MAVLDFYNVSLPQTLSLRIISYIALAAIPLAILLPAFYNVYLHPLRNVPGPKLWIAFPILFHITRIRGNIDAETVRLHDKYGEKVRVHANMVSFTSAQSWRDIYGRDSGILKPSFGEGMSDAQDLFSTNSDVAHARFRRVLHHRFSESGIRKLEPTVRTYVDMLLDNIHKSADIGDEIDFTSLFHRLAFDVIGALTFGEDFDGLRSGVLHPWCAAIFGMVQAITVLMLFMDYPWIWKIITTLMSKAMVKAKEKHEVITREKTTRRLQNKSLRGNGDFTDTMMDAQGGPDEFSRAEINAHASMFIIAGSETTATSMAGNFYWISKTPRVLERVCNEIRSAFSREQDITFASTASDRLPYLNACLNESFRIYPPAQAGMVREVPRSQTRVVDGIILPGETKVVVHQRAAFTTEHHFHQALEFIPERWLPESTKDPASPFFLDNRATFWPFGSGPRRCIAQAFAMNELRYIFARLFWNFDLKHMNQDCEHWHVQKAWFAWDKPPLNVSLTPRKAEQKVSCIERLTKEFGSSLSFPGSDTYTATLATYFSQQASSMAPYCIVKPQNAQQVSAIVAIIGEDGDYQFAIKSQGNAPCPGFAGIDKGVLIDVTGLNNVSVNADHSVASVGPGAKWADVYTFLDPLEKTVAGGRIGSVGVSGLTLGGGISFFSPRVGFTCDTVTDFEVVLASGELVHANETSHKDLFKALKGGMNNFGVVTQISFRTLPLPGGEVLGGLIINPWPERDAVFQAFSKIANDPAYDLNVSLLTSGIYNSTSRSWMLMSSPVYTQPIRHPKAYEELFSCPNIKDMMKVQKLSTMVNYPAMPKENVLFYTATYGVTAEFLHVIFDVSSGILDGSPDGVKWVFALEPLPAATYGYGAGKNVLGTSTLDGNGFVFFLTASWADAEMNADADAIAQRIMAAVNAAAKERDLLRRFVYVNYADKSQDPFGSYGEESRAFLQRVSKEYDPDGVFQKMVPGGFKLWQ